MSEKEKIIVEFMEELISIPQHLYEEVKATLLSYEAGNEHMNSFLIKAFGLAEERRPKLLETKGGATA